MVASLPVFAIGARGDWLHAAITLVIVVAVALGWELLFARVRERPVDAGWPMMAWLFTALMGPETPYLVAALGISFAAVFGKHVFGGSGRYVASPALLGALFVDLSYPESRAAPFASASVLACVLGATILVGVGAASLRTVLGMVAAGLLAAWVLADGAWSFATGSFAFAAAFVITDPTTAALTPSGRWIHGALAGLLAVAISVLDPAGTDGTLYAVLFATLCVPIVDHLVLGFVRRGQ